jgi:hypothetical protein
MWKMDFDGASSWEGVRDSVLFISPSGKTLSYSLGYSLKQILQTMPVNMKLLL